VVADRFVLHRPGAPGVPGVPGAKAAGLRRFLSRHAKSNGIDADTLAGCRWSIRPVAPVGAARPAGGGRVGPASPGLGPVQPNIASASAFDDSQNGMPPEPSTHHLRRGRGPTKSEFWIEKLTTYLRGTKP
jgi:hypothetical protein